MPIIFLWIVRCTYASPLMVIFPSYSNEYLAAQPGLHTSCACLPKPAWFSEWLWVKIWNPHSHRKAKGAHEKYWSSGSFQYQSLQSFSGAHMWTVSLPTPTNHHNPNRMASGTSSWFSMKIQSLKKLDTSTNKLTTSYTSGIQIRYTIYIYI